MAEEYDQITAFHYAAFRPLLHLPILKACLNEGKEYSLGLDVGCGTGQSSIALTNFCKKVHGIEPGKEMLEKSIAHPKIAYSHYDGQNFDFPDNFFDITTFAGSLYYGKSQHLLNEVVRIGKNASLVIIYDFELSLDSLHVKLNLEPLVVQGSDYDHLVNFDGLNKKHINVEKEVQGKVSMEIAISDISHLLLSYKDNYNRLLQSLGENDLYETVSQKLRSILKSESTFIDAKTYATMYRVTK
ncbi:class I SAM-dependent methyltransferase [Ulvibacterium sp.]|uniref:class I SAM-dependent methyltransferase n=1 Tax=Ulvibacterium sp. TaxID=2665914 RepID=UPI002628C9A1|nr:class I SAM-dependent methyltransferase [Ulvibacterium sp.]